MPENMTEAVAEAPKCNVCGEVILTTAGDFTLPDGIVGVACGVCGPKVEAYLESGDPSGLPDGPLVAYLAETGRVTAGLMLLDLLRWLSAVKGSLQFDGKQAIASCVGPDGKSYAASSQNMIEALKNLAETVSAKAKELEGPTDG